MLLQNRPRIKSLLSLAILTLCVYFAYRYGEHLRDVPTRLVVYTALISVAIVFINAIALYYFVAGLEGKVTFRDVLHMAALGSLANALGGLPIGSAAKFVLLYQKSGFSLTRITLIFLSLTLSLVVLFGFTAAAAFTAMSTTINYATVTSLAILFVVLFAIAIQRTRHLHYRLAEFAGFISNRNTLKAFAFSLVNGLLMIACYFVLVDGLLEGAGFADKLFLISSGLLLGFSTGSPASAGIQEITMASASSLINLPAVFGLELALIIRLSSAIAAALLLLVPYLQQRFANQPAASLPK